MTPPPFEIPIEPIDRYEVRWFKVEPYFGRVEEGLAVYHKNTTWRELYPEDPVAGVDIVNEWMIHHDGRATGRSDEGWRALLEFDWWNDRHFKTRKEALQALLKTFQEKEIRLRKELSELEEKFARTGEELRNVELTEQYA